MSEQAGKKQGGNSYSGVLKILVVCVTLLALAWMAQRALVDKPKESAKEVVAAIFGGNGRMTVTSTDIKGRPVVMYSLYEKEFTTRYVYATTWLASTKRLELEQRYRVRYGIDATLPGMQADWVSPGVISVDNIVPQVVSCERVGKIVSAEDDGWFNKLQPEERDAAQAYIDKQARQDALADAAALEMVRRRVLDVLNAESRYEFVAPPKN